MKINNRLSRLEARKPEPKAPSQAKAKLLASLDAVADRLPPPNSEQLEENREWFRTCWPTFVEGIRADAHK